MEDSKDSIVKTVGFVDIDPYYTLANAIIILAVQDYIKARNDMIDAECDNDQEKWYESKKDLKKLERFFHSQWFGILTNLDPDYLIDLIEKNKLAQRIKRAHDSGHKKGKNKD